MKSTLLIALLLCSGCTSSALISYRLSSNDHEKPAPSGIQYSLPKDLIKISYSRTPIDIEGLKKKLDEAATALTVATKSKTDSENEVKLIEQQIEGIDNTQDDAVAAALADLKKKLVLANSIMTIKTKFFSDADKAHKSYQAQYLALLAGNLPNAIFSESLTFEIDQTVPDDKYRFVAVQQDSFSSSTKLKLTVEDGYLSGATGSSEGTTADSLITLASTLVGFNQFGLPKSANSGLMMALDSSQVNTDKCNLTKTSVTWSTVVDPDNQTEVENAAKALKETYCVSFALTESPWKYNNAFKTESCTKDDEKCVSDQVAGLVYREPGHIAWKMSVVPGYPSDLAGQTIYQKVSQGGPISFIALPNRALTKETYDIAFKKGRLVHSEIDMPSQFAEVASYPSQFIKGIFALPTELIQLKINLTSNQKQLEDLNQQLYAAKLELQKQILLNNNFNASEFSDSLTLDDYKTPPADAVTDDSTETGSD